MEDIFNILITIGMVILAISAGRKKRPQRTKKAEPAAELPNDLPEGWPIPREFFPGTEPARPVPKRKQPPRPKAGAKPDRTAPENVSGPGKTARQAAGTHTPAHNIAPPPKSDAEHPDMADFDLRKAVIWSEILKPKFDR